MSSLVTNAKHELQNTRETGVAQGLVKLGRGDPLGLLQEHPRRRQAPHLRHNFREPCRCSFIRNRNSGLMKGYFETVLDRCRTKLKASPYRTNST